MLLNDLIEPLARMHRVGSGNPDITSLIHDSRRVGLGSLFICVRGEKFDGHDFIADAVRNGACAIVADDAKRIERMVLNVPVVLVSDTRPILPVLANRFFDNPSRRLKLVGVTGTKGKTTTTYLIESMIRSSGMASGVIGTLGVQINGQSVPLDRTTPESVDLQDFLARMVSEGVSAAAMEVSSHALVMRRTEGCEFDVGVFTNLTHDHLDFHHTLDEYLRAKLMLFSVYPRSTRKPFTAVINIDDPAGEKVRAESLGKILTYGIRNEADITASNIDAGANGVSFDVTSPIGACRIDLKIGGVFNVYNSLAAFGAGIGLGMDIEQIKLGLESLQAVPGRFEAVDCGQDFGVIVDYAHTPDSLENILRAARELTSRRLIVVFGCGGDRDRTKRPKMGSIGANMADVCIVTSDNPRGEDPWAIIDEVMVGTTDGHATVESITDRREAISRALSIAEPGDLVVVAGKGHEPYQIFRDRTIHFDDREVVREALSCRENGSE
jgi:UDP-N-acetylmuramoyl-L-alanyl-D-glutamate--2,6-diaminopimelate ligase